MVKYQECTHCDNIIECKADGLPILKLTLRRPILVNLSMHKNECNTFAWGND
jgi:hypothetical protein